MGQQSLIYSFVARGTVILAEYTEFQGNFTGIAAQCLQKLPSSNNRFTYNCDGHTFNYLVEDGYSEPLYLDRFLLPSRYWFDMIWFFYVVLSRSAFLVYLMREWAFVYWLVLGVLWGLSGVKLFVVVVIRYAYCVVAVESVGRQIPIAFLDRIKEDFNKRYGGGKAATARANSLNREFGSKLKEHMQYCVDHPEEISKLAKVKAQVSEVKGVMMENIEKVLERGEKIELLVDKTENLRSQVGKLIPSSLSVLGASILSDRIGICSCTGAFLFVHGLNLAC
ncbi:hypothetical protein C4D60_Mb04t29430 [Musa balbisiana]|uniref:Longin domain-containing protein n=1 Tax=Musa balbisiana TaxID=52838 RepID=A0A4S8KFI5_MUSBA|nr:hypothetical protein C4D60_Mb04t29430 [Musa balbisiana]